MSRRFSIHRYEIDKKLTMRCLKCTLSRLTRFGIGAAIGIFLITLINRKSAKDLQFTPGLKQGESFSFARGIKNYLRKKNKTLSESGTHSKHQNLGLYFFSPYSEFETSGTEDEEIHNHLSHIDVLCTDVTSVGDEKNQWSFCGSWPYKPTHSSCTVYSYSHSPDADREMDIIAEYNCSVRLVNYEIHAVPVEPRLRVFPFALHPAWAPAGRTMMESFDAFDDDENVIDYVIIDGQHNNIFDIFRTIFYNGSLKRVKQLLLTLTLVSSGPLRDRKSPRWLLDNLERSGFRKWSVRKEVVRTMLPGYDVLVSAVVYHLGFINVNAMNGDFKDPARHLDLLHYLTWQDISPAKAEQQLERFFMRLHYKCRTSVRVGKTVDGGWDMCLDAGLKPSSPCLVYSFGINWDWSFDDRISQRYGCHVRAYDPSMGIEDSNRSSLVTFNNKGLGATETRSRHRKWKVYSLKQLLTENRDQKATIDYLKIDIEYSEWEALEEMLRDGVLAKVKQIGIEIHKREIHAGNPASTLPDMNYYYRVLRDLEHAGFRKWKVHRNQRGFYTSGHSGERRTCCFEMYYINKSFLS